MYVSLAIMLHLYTVPMQTTSLNKLANDHALWIESVHDFWFDVNDHKTVLV